MTKPLPDAFFARPVLEVAPVLLNKVLVADATGHRSGRIVEVEAYGGEDDAGSHGWRGVTPRTEIMFGPPGHWYVYLSYGVHWCANVVCGPVGVCSAVLIRAIEPLTGIDQMRAARPKARRDADLANGPGKLTVALGVDGQLNGSHIASSPLRIVDDGVLPPERPTQTVRVGLSEGRAEDTPWRFTV